MVRFIFHKSNALIGFHIMHVIINKAICAVIIPFLLCYPGLWQISPRLCCDVRVTFWCQLLSQSLNKDPPRLKCHNLLTCLNFRAWIVLCSSCCFFFFFECSKWKQIGPKILTFYSNSLPLIFFLVFQGFDWRSGSVDPNPWSWMSGSIREGIGKDGCSERDQFFFPGFKWDLNSELIIGSPRATFFPLFLLGAPTYSNFFQW